MNTFNKKETILKLKEYFNKKPSVIMGFLFGSYARGFYTQDSDIDIGIYFKSEKMGIEWEEHRDFPEEIHIWRDLTDLLKMDVELLVLNRANSKIASEVLRTGIPLVIKNKKIYWDFYLIVSRESEDLREFVKDYWEIYQRSQSISEEDKSRLIERIHFIEQEIKEFPLYRNLNIKIYSEDKVQRRNIERWIETLCNAGIDVAKIILATQNKEMPSTYREALLKFAFMMGYENESAQEFADFARLRNILSHEYLEIRFQSIKNFIDRAEPYFKMTLEFTKKLLNNP